VIRPGELCAALLEALEASDGRRRRRKRDTTPDALGMALKRELLAQAVEANPEPEAFEAWLLQRCLARTDIAVGAWRAMALDIVGEWRLAAASPEFWDWLAAGARSEDRNEDPAALPRDAGAQLPSKG
jgi:hypothetical protein